MPYSPRNIRIACNHAGLTHYGGVYFFHEFLRVLQLRHFLARHLTYPRRNNRYHLSQMVLALMYPIVLGLDRLETASFLRSNGTFQYLTGLPSFPDPQTLRRFLHNAPDPFWQQLHRVNDRLLQTFIHLPARRSRLIFDLDSTVVTVFGNQENAAVGYNPRYRGKKSYDPLLCIEANSSYLWDAELRPGNAGTWDGSMELLDTSFANVPPEIREVRVRADAGFGFNPVFVALETRPAQYAVVARLTQAFKRLLPGISYEPVNPRWEMAEVEHRLHGWPKARRFVVARRFIQQDEAETTLFAMGRYIYRVSVAVEKGTKMAANWHPAGRAVRSEPFPRIRRRCSERPEAVKGAPLLGAAKRTLDGEDRSEMIAEEGKAGRNPSERWAAILVSSPAASNNRAWVTNMPLTPAGIWHFYDGRAGMEPRICELREDYALRKIPTASFAANALYLEIVRLAYNLVTAFQRNCLDESWQNLTLQKLRYKLFLIPGELTRPQNRPVLRLRPSPMIEGLAEKILARAAKLKPLQP